MKLILIVTALIQIQFFSTKAWAHQLACPRLLIKLLARHCCSAIKTTHAEPISKYASYDPYYAGKNRASFQQISDVSHYLFLKPETVGGWDFEFYLTDSVDVKNEQALSEILSGHHQNRFTSDEMAPAGEGNFSVVNYYDSDAPDVWNKLWLKENAKYVVKFRKKERKKTLFRDLAIGRLFSQMAEYATLNGQNFLRVAKDYTTPEMLSAGITMQEAIHGPSAYEMQMALNTWDRSDKSRKLLLNAGINPESVEERFAMQNLILALERFYLDTHTDVIRFEKKNFIYRISNVLPNNYTTLVGFDFNHGRNILWSKNEKIWVAIDW